MTWDIQFTAKAEKQTKALPQSIQERLMALVQALRLTGPVQAGMPHFGKLKGQTDTYHCHLKQGKPTYVAVWQALKKMKQVVLTYVGTHENAPY